MADGFELSVFNTRVLPNIETLCDMRANGASISSLARFCGVSLSSFRDMISRHPDIETQLERAYQANLSKVRAALFAKAVGGKKVRSVTTVLDAENKVLSRTVKDSETEPDMQAIKAVLTMSGEMAEVPSTSINIDARSLSQQANRLVEAFNLEVQDAKPIENKWKVED